MALLEKDRFLLGVFGPNCSSGMSVTKVPERWDNSWENNVTLARMLEDAGFDFILPVARWIGHGGETNFQGNSLETFTWAAGLVALTKKIKLVVTSHTTVIHPVAAAKQIATIDQISPGRVALNIVAGWNKPEYDALGMDLPASHEQRYAFAEEWCQIVRALWTRKEAFDWDGQFWKLKNVLSYPQPAQQPTVLNAAGSGEGRAFATRNADLLFTVVFDPAKAKGEIADLKAQAAEAGREVGVLTTIYVVCRPTEQEAKDYLAYYVDQNADWDGADRLMTGLITHSKSFPLEVSGLMSNALLGCGIHADNSIFSPSGTRQTSLWNGCRTRFLGSCWNPSASCGQDLAIA